MGLTNEQIDLLEGDAWRESPLFDDRDKAAIHWAVAVTDLTAHGDDAGFEALQRHFTTQQIVELTLLCSMWNMSNRFAEALHLVVEPPEHRIAFQPALAGAPARGRAPGLRDGGH